MKWETYSPGNRKAPTTPSYETILAANACDSSTTVWLERCFPLTPVAIIIATREKIHE